MSAYFYIYSKESGNVLENMGPSVAVAIKPKATATADSQLWQQVPTGSPDPSGAITQYHLENKKDQSILSQSNPAVGQTVITTAPPGSASAVWSLPFAESPSWLRVHNPHNGLECMASGTQVVLAKDGQGSSFNFVEVVQKPAYATGRKKDKGMGKKTVMGTTTVIGKT